MSVVMILIMFGIFLLIMGIILLIVNTKKNKKCPGCKNVIQPNTNSCPYCGYIIH